MRYIPHNEADIQIMLKKIGVQQVDELFDQIPQALRFKGELDLPPPMHERELMGHLTGLARETAAEQLVSFAGAGAYAHHVPPAVDQILLRSEFYTAYTPYQPEVSQGTVQAIFEFQTLISRLLGLPVANASMYDCATATAEAALMARRVTKRDRVLISSGLHPDYQQVLQNYLSGLDQGEQTVETIPLVPETGATDLAALESRLGGDVAAVVAGHPNFFGIVEPFDQIAEMAREQGVLAISVTAEPFAFGVLASPGALGADIAVAEGQPLGTSLSFGGPGLGLFACRDERRLIRQMPGRLAGQTVDVTGKTGYVLTLSTREQHIRREKATSNICTNQGLCALAVTVNLCLLGKHGFGKVAAACLAGAEFLKRGIARIPGLALVHQGPTFNEFAVRTEHQSAAELIEKMTEFGFLAGVDISRFGGDTEDVFLVAVTECHTAKMLETYLEALEKV